MKVKLKDITQVDKYYEKTIRQLSLETNTGNPKHNNVCLKPDKEYDVLEIQRYDYRIIDENGEPCLHDKRIFDIVDPSIPKDYIYQFYFEDDEKTVISEYGETWRDFEEEYNITPSCFSQRAFFDLYFDGHSEQVKIFNEYIKDLGFSCSN